MKGLLVVLLVLLVVVPVAAAPEPPPPDLYVVSCSWRLPGDASCNCYVDGSDWAWFVRPALGTCHGDREFIPAGDLNFDGCVDDLDTEVWYDNRGARCEPEVPDRPIGLLWCDHEGCWHCWWCR